MATFSEDNDTLDLLISNKEVILSSDVEATEDNDLILKTPERESDRYNTCNSSTDGGGNSTFGALGGWLKLLLRWWKTLVILLTPLILLLLFAIAEDTRVRRVPM